MKPSNTRKCYETRENLQVLQAQEKMLLVLSTGKRASVRIALVLSLIHCCQKKHAAIGWGTMQEFFEPILQSGE